MITYKTNLLLLQDLLTSFGLRCTSDKPTRVFVNKNGRISSTKIDYITTNEQISKGIQPNIGDHKNHSNLNEQQQYLQNECIKIAGMKDVKSEMSLSTMGH